MQKHIAAKLAFGLIAALLVICPAAYDRKRGNETAHISEARLQQLEDRAAISQLIMDYGRFLDQRDWDSFSRLFAEKDGEWIGGMGSAKGSAGIRKLMVETIGAKTSTSSFPNYHIFTNQTINLDGDRATATTKWMFIVQGMEKRPQIALLGHYEDSLIRENGRWKFLRRVVHSDIPEDRH